MALKQMVLQLIEFEKSWVKHPSAFPALTQGPSRRALGLFRIVDKGMDRSGRVSLKILSSPFLSSYRILDKLLTLLHFGPFICKVNMIPLDRNGICLKSLTLRKPSKILVVTGLERGLSSREHSRLLWATQAELPAPRCLFITVTPVSGHGTPSSGFHKRCVQVMHIRTYRPNHHLHTDK